MHAVATTFTLHLTALLTVPLGLAGADLTASTDPLSVLQAVRSYADRVDVFCQAGHVSVPEKSNDLLAFLEQMIHQVKAPSPGHLFHPKIWVLRFVNDELEERYRVVCGSRNLTEDRAWDAVVCLEGTVTGRIHAVNRPLADFLLALPGRVPAKVHPNRRRAIRDLAANLRYVEWEAPHDVHVKDWLAFHVFGSGKSPRIDMSGYRRLVVSPFLNDGGLDRVCTDEPGQCMVVSRDEQLNGLSAEWREWLETGADLRVVNDGAAIPEPESEEAGLRWSLSGLHAKINVVERNKEAHVFVGSANATDAAWGGNDEIMVEIVGRPRTYGVEATAGQDPKSGKSLGFGGILIPFEFGEVAGPDPESDLRWILEGALRELASLTYTASVVQARSSISIVVSSAEVLRLPAGVPQDRTLTFELLTLPGTKYSPPIAERLLHEWGMPEIEDITPFLIIRLSAGTGADAVRVSTVAVAKLENDPDDRLDRILARRFKEPADFLRFILLLLQMSGRESWIPEGVGGGSFGRFSIAEDGAGLLEPILAVLASNPDAVIDIDRLARRLESTEAGRKVLPEGWTHFWQPVMEAHARLVGGE